MYNILIIILRLILLYQIPFPHKHLDLISNFVAFSSYIFRSAKLRVDMHHQGKSTGPINWVDHLLADIYIYIYLLRHACFAVHFLGYPEEKRKHCILSSHQGLCSPWEGSLPDSEVIGAAQYPLAGMKLQVRAVGGPGARDRSTTGMATGLESEWEWE